MWCGVVWCGVVWETHVSTANLIALSGQLERAVAPFRVHEAECSSVEVEGNNCVVTPLAFDKRIELALVLRTSAGYHTFTKIFGVDLGLLAAGDRLRQSQRLLVHAQAHRPVSFLHP